MADAEVTPARSSRQASRPEGAADVTEFWDGSLEVYTKEEGWRRYKGCTVEDRDLTLCATNQYSIPLHALLGLVSGGGDSDSLVLSLCRNHSREVHLRTATTGQRDALLRAITAELGRFRFGGGGGVSAQDPREEGEASGSSVRSWILEGKRAMATCKATPLGFAAASPPPPFPLTTL